jgi:CheY-like chemotaxis protein
MARIGLLEDNSRISKLCATMLSYAGHDVTVYMDAGECLNALFHFDLSLRRGCPLAETNQSIVLPIDVLILDLHLPTMPGVELLRILRSSDHTSTLPLILCTAATVLEINQAFAIAPNAALVEKPFRLQSLVSAIASVLPTHC